MLHSFLCPCFLDLKCHLFKLLPSTSWFQWLIIYYHLFCFLLIKVTVSIFFPAENGRQDENPSLLELPSANSEAEPQPLVSCSSHVSHTGALACKAKLQRVLAGQNHNHKSKLCEKLFPVEFGDAPSQLHKYQSGFQLQLQAPWSVWNH